MLEGGPGAATRLRTPGFLATKLIAHAEVHPLLRGMAHSTALARPNKFGLTTAWLYRERPDVTIKVVCDYV